MQQQKNNRNFFILSTPFFGSAGLRMSLCVNRNRSSDVRRDIATQTTMAISIGPQIKTIYLEMEIRSHKVIPPLSSIEELQLVTNHHGNYHSPTLLLRYFLNLCTSPILLFRN